VLVAVGAVFDFFSGRTKMAPDYVHEAGFAWLYRMLGSDRRRLWRRYTIDHSYFLWHFGRQLLGLSRPEIEMDPR
jgi:N-acetylglucosaminyldiphosphoundecaprenol N-acetyl-beta-D-mannosaminyltransferase